VTIAMATTTTATRGLAVRTIAPSFCLIKMGYFREAIRALTCAPGRSFHTC
jgi:hypothetical protein